MKIPLFFTCFLLSLILLSAGCTNKNETNQTPQGLGRVLFNALKADDKAAFDQYIYTDADRDELLKSIREDQRLTAEVKSETQQRILTFNRPELEDAFPKLRQRALECGLQDWSNVEYVTSTFSQMDVQNTKMADVRAKFRWNGLEYELDFSRCLQTKRGWVLRLAPNLECKP